MVSSERTGMEGKAKAEQDSLTQAEEEDTSVQAYCADSCRAAHARSQRLAVHQLVGQIIKGGESVAELEPKSSEDSLMHDKSTLCSRLGYSE